MVYAQETYNAYLRTLDDTETHLEKLSQQVMDLAQEKPYGGCGMLKRIERDRYTEFDHSGGGGTGVGRFESARDFMGYAVVWESANQAQATGLSGRNSPRPGMPIPGNFRRPPGATGMAVRENRCWKDEKNARRRFNAWLRRPRIASSQVLEACEQEVEASSG